MTSRQLRLLRGAAASSAATVIAAVSHTVGGGAAPHPLLIAALSVFLTPFSALLVGRRLSLPRLSATVLISQGVFHVLFVALGATVSPALTGSAHHHALPLDLITGGAAPADAGMLGAHIVAALLTIGLLWRGEAMLRAIADWVRAALRTRVPMPHSRPAPASIPRTVRTFARTVRFGDVSRRGPPVLSRG